MTGADQQHADITASSKSELSKLADDLLDAFTKPWEDREPFSLLVSDLADNKKGNLNYPIFDAFQFSFSWPRKALLTTDQCFPVQIQ